MEPIVISVSFFLTVFAIVYVIFSTRHKERMAMIEKGADPRLFKREPRTFKTNEYLTFKWGLFMIGSAIGILAGALLELYSEFPSGACYFSMILIFGGLALVASYLLRGKMDKKQLNP
ncbi:MAG TPA: hypothetical protein PLD74_01565 [Prolixibacteraceae bacterium]|nr:hypothetical protein [Prolixibacteraceae bacterium]HOR99403.1 hypothetical protein [Prolixibacteraceae bacterium]HOS89871.1 hypothetical protein [Prolixibacteraceae bacterium]HPL44546.1 hypothetical protein [Prolixibacteraceae bacterium]HQE51023.1 hypothetical protein [Prolixibacteraceae bacterium]